MSRNALSILSSLLFLLVACGPGRHMPLSYFPNSGGNSNSGGGAPGVSGEINYEDDIRPVFQKRCDTCHNAQSSLANWLDYPTVVAKKDLLQKRFITDRTMPPSPLDRNVTEEERRLVDTWIRGGTLRSKAVAAPPPIPSAIPSPALPPSVEASPSGPEPESVSSETLSISLLKAVALGDIEGAKKLLASGANSNAISTTQLSGPLTAFVGYSPLLIAIKNAAPGMTSVLLGFGADPKIKTPSGETANELAEKIQIDPYRNAIMALLSATQSGGALSQLSYTADIRPILQTRCVMCHNEQALPAMNWMKFENASAERMLIYVRTAVLRDMPIGNVTAMTEEEREKITSWVKTGGSQ